MTSKYCFYTYIHLIFLTLLVIGCQNNIDSKIPTDTEINIEPEETDQSLPRIMRTDQKDRRALWQKPDLVLKALGDASEKVIADIGAGSGYFSFRILPTCKKVIAIDIDKEAIEYMDSIAQILPENYKSNFETRKSTVSDSKLMPNEADVILMVNTYLYIENRIDYLKHLKTVLPPDGQLLIIDYKKKIIPTGPDANQRVALSVAEQEIKLAGFTIINSDDHSLDYQYIILAQP